MHYITSYTVNDAHSDITELADHLKETVFNNVRHAKNSPLFSVEKLGNTSWIKDTLNQNEYFEDNLESEESTVTRSQIDINYELVNAL